MWIFTKYGFFSTVISNISGEMTVRARMKSHLEALQKRFPELNSATIRETLDTDYRYRFYIDKSIWCDVAKQLSEEIDYSNFKGEVSRHSKEQVENNSEYLHALHDVWSVMYKLQQNW